MNLKHPFFSLLAKRKGSSEIVAAVIVFAATLIVSSISIAFLSQRTSLASSMMLQESKRVAFEYSATVKIVDVLKTGLNETTLVLYNPSDLVIHVIAVIVGSDVQRVDKILEPTGIVDVSINSPEDAPLSNVRLLTVEGVLIDARP